LTPLVPFFVDPAAIYGTAIQPVRDVATSRRPCEALGHDFYDGNSDFTIVLYDSNSVTAYDGNSVANR